MNRYLIEVVYSTATTCSSQTVDIIAESHEAAFTSAADQVRRKWRGCKIRRTTVRAAMPWPEVGNLPKP